MGGQIDGGGGLGEGELVGDKPARVELPREDQAGHFPLQLEIRGIAPNQVLLIHTNRREIDGRLLATPRVGEKQQLAAATD